ncbi:MAG: hypothetical protein ACRD5M_14205 [Candidatus Acidiferrales bacterium]
MPTSSTKRTLIAVAVILCVAAAGAGVYLYRQHRPLAGASSGAAPELLSQLPADAPAVGYINVAALRELRSSPLAAILGLSSPGPQADREYAEFVRETGFDYTRDLDRAAIAAWPQSLVPPAGGMGENRILAIADGRFNEERIKTYALRTGRIVTHGTQSVYEVPGNPPLAFVFLSPIRIALASGKNASELITASVGKPRDPGMQERIARVAGAPIFAVARTDQLPSSFYANLASSPQLERLARSVRGLSLAGQPDGDKITVALDAECDSMTNALQLATLLDIFRMGSSMALSDPKTRRQMTQEQAAFLRAVINQVKVTHQDKWVRLTLDITPEMLGATRSNSADLPPAAPRHERN